MAHAVWAMTPDETQYFIPEVATGVSTSECTGTGLDNMSFIPVVGGVGLEFTLPALDVALPGKAFEASITCGSQTQNFTVEQVWARRLEDEMYRIAFTNTADVGRPMDDIASIDVTYTDTSHITAEKSNPNKVFERSAQRHFVAYIGPDGTDSVMEVEPNGLEVPLSADAYYSGLHEWGTYDYVITFTDGTTKSGTQSATE